MQYEIISEEELENIVGGALFDDLTMVSAIVTIIATLVAIYKIYMSTKGKAKIGNDFTFEWQWAR